MGAMDFTRRGFSGLLGMLAGAGPVTTTLVAAGPDEPTVIHVDSERMKPKPPVTKRMLVVYKPWAIDATHIAVMHQNMAQFGAQMLALPTTDASAPDIRFFDLDQAGAQGAMETLEAIKADIFDRKPPAEIGSMHEIAMLVAKMVFDRLHHVAFYCDRYRKHGARLNMDPVPVPSPDNPDGPMSRYERALQARANACVRVSTLDVNFSSLDRLAKVFLEPCAEAIALSLNAAEGAIITADLPLPNGVYGAAGVEYQGVALRGFRSYDVVLDEWLLRFDVLAGRWTEPVARDQWRWNQSVAVFVEPRYAAQWPSEA